MKLIDTFLMLLANIFLLFLVVLFNLFDSNPFLFCFELQNLVFIQALQRLLVAKGT